MHAKLYVNQKKKKSERERLLMFSGGSNIRTDIIVLSVRCFLLLVFPKCIEMLWRSFQGFIGNQITLLVIGHFETLFSSLETVFDPKSELLCLCTVGVPQGFVFGPLKFSCIVRKIPPGFLSSHD